MKLNSGPIVRTTFGLFALLVAFALVAAPGFARELRVTTPRDLINCPEGLPLRDGPDQGLQANPGDECVVLAGNYDLNGVTNGNGAAGASTGQVVILVENLTLRSSDGASATVITNSVGVAGGLITIAAEGVTVGGSKSDQGFTITNAQAGPGICVSNHGGNQPFINHCIPGPVYTPVQGFPQQLRAPYIADERITIQNNDIQDNAAEGILFNYTGNGAATIAQTSLDTVQILDNRIFRNGGDGIAFDSSISALGRRGQNRNVVIDGNTLDNNDNALVGAVPLNFGWNGVGTAPTTYANVHFYTGSTIEQLAITDNTITRAFPNCTNSGATAPGVSRCGDGILFDNGVNTALGVGGFLPAIPAGGSTLNNLRDTLIDGNLIQFNTQNGVKFDFGQGSGRVDENVIIRNNRGNTPDQGITHNGPGNLRAGGGVAIPFKFEGNGVYLTQALGDIRGLDLVNNAINSNYGWDGTTLGLPAGGGYTGTACRDGNGVSIEVNGRVENLNVKDNDLRLNFNDGFCIANRGDVDTSTFADNVFRNNGVGDLQNQDVTAPYGDGLGIYHDDDLVYFDGATGTAAAFPGGPSTIGFRVERLTFSGNTFRENGGSSFTAFAAGVAEDNGTGCAALAGVCAAIAPVNSQSGLGFGLFVRTQRADIDTLSFDGDQFLRNQLGGLRLDTDNGPNQNVRSGDVRKITIKDVTASENQGNPQLPSFGNTINDNGDGIANVSDTGDLSNISVDPTTASNNGEFGLRIETDGSAEWNAPNNTAATAGDVDTISVSDSTFEFNGTRAAVGRGSGMLVSGDSVRTVDANNDSSNNNNDHGLQVSGARDVSNVTVKGSQFNENDRNTDTIGDGVQVNANEDLSNITIDGNTSNGNYGGYRAGAAGRQIGQNIQVTNNTANDNRKEGVAVSSGQDLTTVKIDGNTLQRNGFGITVSVKENGVGIEVTNNKIDGNNGVGTGIDLNSNGVNISGNSIRKNATGVLVRRSDSDAINGNNIARNEDFGIDASPLAPGRTIDATGNWWGEPSGPKTDRNPNGIGDRITDAVEFDPFMTEPAVATNVDFQITDFNVPATADTESAITVSATVTNQGTEEGNQEITMTVTNNDTDNVVGVKSTTKTINPAASTDVSFDFTFPTGGSYTVEISTANDSQSQDVTVTGPTGTTIEAVCDANGNNRIDDDEILTCIGFWVNGTEVPGTGQKISDEKILFLIGLWVNNSDISTLPAAAQAAPAGWMQAVVNFFAPAAEVTQAADVVQVAPGGSFTVTATISANETLQGLLLSEQLPAGWTVSNVTTDSGFYNANQTKWLWLSGQRQAVTFAVTVPANAQAGSYTLSSSLKTADGFAATSALSVRVAQPLRVERVAFTGSRFVAEGVGISGLDVQVYSLSGSLAFAGSSQGAALSFSGADLANGVYLYVVTVKGADGQTVRTSVDKLAVLR